jgi:hypothetical protein
MKCQLIQHIYCQDLHAKAGKWRKVQKLGDLFFTTQKIYKIKKIQEDIYEESLEDCPRLVVED